MQFRRPDPVHTLPDDYQQVYHLAVTDNDKLAALNLVAIILVPVFIALMIAWMMVAEAVRGSFSTSWQVPDVLLVIAALGVLPLHEWIHGVAIRWAGHRPRFGMKGVKVGLLTIPYVLFATADDAYFQRDPFILIALAPVVVITLAGMALMLILPDYTLGYIALAVTINGSGAAGDLWMSVVALRYPTAHTLVQDEADRITIFVQQDHIVNKCTFDH
ncbi:MAG: DUF3267 domain-containing protein [Chloroflexota bacterium]